MSRLANVNRYARGGGGRRGRSATPRRWLTVFLGIAVCIAVVKTFTLITHRSNLVDRGINAAAMPLVLAVRYTGEGLASLGQVFRLPSLLRENAQLRAENATLKRQGAESDYLRSTNDELRAALKVQAPNFKALSAVVIARPYDLWLDQVILDKGAGDGVHSGDLVMNVSGVVGVVDTRVEGSRCWVTLVTSPRFRLAAVTGKSLSEGVIRGFDTKTLDLQGVRRGAESADRGNLELAYVKSGSAVTVGENVFSSGVAGEADSGFRRPAGVLIGTVIQRNVDPNGLLEVRVAPAVNPNRISMVAVMTQ